MRVHCQFTRMHVLLTREFLYATLVHAYAVFNIDVRMHAKHEGNETKGCEKKGVVQKEQMRMKFKEKLIFLRVNFLLFEFRF